MSVSAEYQKDEESKLLTMLKGDSVMDFPVFSHVAQHCAFEAESVV